MLNGLLAWKTNVPDDQSLAMPIILLNCNSRNVLDWVRCIWMQREDSCKHAEEAAWFMKRFHSHYTAS